MDRIHCGQCGSGVITDPEGRCPDGHAVTIASLSPAGPSAHTGLSAAGASPNDLEPPDDVNSQALVAALEALADARVEHADDAAHQPAAVGPPVEAHPSVDAYPSDSVLPPRIDPEVERERATTSPSTVRVGERPAAPETGTDARPDLRNFTSRGAHTGASSATRRRWSLRRR